METKFLLSFILFLLFSIFINASIFQDLIQGDFDNGTYSNTEYNVSGGFVQLSFGNISGNFTSQIFNALYLSNWTNISWTTNALGNFPNNQQVETSFGSGNANMTGNVLLLHMDILFHL